nr:immunoglobulin heavy chain junction region [Mus musculus]
CARWSYYGKTGTAWFAYW